METLLPIFTNSLCLSLLFSFLNKDTHSHLRTVSIVFPKSDFTNRYEHSRQRWSGKNITNSQYITLT